MKEWPLQNITKEEFTTHFEKMGYELIWYNSLPVNIHTISMVQPLITSPARGIKLQLGSGAVSPYQTITSGMGISIGQWQPAQLQNSQHLQNQLGPPYTTNNLTINPLYPISIPKTPKYTDIQFILFHKTYKLFVSVNRTMEHETINLETLINYNKVLPKYTKDELLENIVRNQYKEELTEFLNGFTFHNELEDILSN